MTFQYKGVKIVMKLRSLAEKDAESMLEWMHDLDVVEKMGTDFQNKTIHDCISFIKNSPKDNSNFHRAIVNDMDEYLGTVSLKKINKNEKTAEFAIVIRKKAMGCGIASWAMQEILSIGKNELGLQRIFWCVRKDNSRANRFYIKNGYRKTFNIPENLRHTYNEGLDLNWFVWEA